jgi:hypothetical protein
MELMAEMVGFRRVCDRAGAPGGVLDDKSSDMVSPARLFKAWESLRVMMVERKTRPKKLLVCTYRLVITAEMLVCTKGAFHALRGLAQAGAGVREAEVVEAVEEVVEVCGRQVQDE